MKKKFLTGMIALLGVSWLFLGCPSGDSPPRGTRRGQTHAAHGFVSAPQA